MEWTETRETAAARARLRNSVENSPIQITLKIVLSAVLFGLLPVVGMTVKAIIEHKSVLWVAVLIFAPGCSVAGVFMCLLDLLKRWNRAGTCRYNIILDSQKVTVSGKGFTRTATYGDLVGFSVFDLSESVSGDRLLVFGDPMGKNLSVGIPPEISMADIRTFLSSKLNELSNQEMPDPRNPYAVKEYHPA